MARSTRRYVDNNKSPIQLSRLKRFNPIDWWSERQSSRTSEIIQHLLKELGRLNVELKSIEDYVRHPHMQTVLSDVLAWLCEHPGEAYARLVDWRRLDIESMRIRLSSERSAKARIEISARITKMKNLSVRWYPKGWSDAEFNWNNTHDHDLNHILRKKWNEVPDFFWFSGDEDGAFGFRPSNELMFIRGVGNLSPEPRDNYDLHEEFNRDVVHSILVCLVRSVYEDLIEQLRNSFDVTVLDQFHFSVRSEDSDISAQFSGRLSRVVAWSLEDAAELEARRELAATNEAERRGREAYENIESTYGFTIELFLDELSRASAPYPNGRIPSQSDANRIAAKALRNLGYGVNAGHVAVIRVSIQKYATPEFQCKISTIK